MFDVAFSEILVIAVVALLVIGPEKLPKVARTLGMLTGRVQRYVSSVKADIDRELRLDEVRRFEREAHKTILGKQSDMATEVNRLENEVKTSLESGKPDNPA